MSNPCQFVSEEVDKVLTGERAKMAIRSLSNVSTGSSSSSVPSCPGSPSSSDSSSSSYVSADSSGHSSRTRDRPGSSRNASERELAPLKVKNRKKPRSGIICESDESSLVEDFSVLGLHLDKENKPNSTDRDYTDTPPLKRKKVFNGSADVPHVPAFTATTTALRPAPIKVIPSRKSPCKITDTEIPTSTNPQEERRNFRLGKRKNEACPISYSDAPAPAPAPAPTSAIEERKIRLREKECDHRKLQMDLDHKLEIKRIDYALKVLDDAQQTRQHIETMAGFN